MLPCLYLTQCHADMPVSLSGAHPAAQAGAGAGTVHRRCGDPLGWAVGSRTVGSAFTHVWSRITTANAYALKNVRRARVRQHAMMRSDDLFHAAAKMQLATCTSPSECPHSFMWLCLASPFSTQPATTRLVTIHDHVLPASTLR